MTVQQIAERMGADATDAEASAMIEILRERGISDLEGVEEMDDEVFFALIPEAIQRAQENLLAEAEHNDEMDYPVAGEDGWGRCEEKK